MPDKEMEEIIDNIYKAEVKTYIVEVMEISYRKTYIEVNAEHDELINGLVNQRAIVEAQNLEDADWKYLDSEFEINDVKIKEVPNE